MAYDFFPRDPLRDLGRALITAFVKETAATLPSGARVLDLGAGEAAYAPLFEHCRYVAVDSAIGDGRWSYRALSVFGDAARLPFDDGAFDGVVMTELLEHVVDPRAVLAETRRVLRRGGSLFATAPMSHPLHQEPHDYFRYTSFGLDALLRAAGFDVVDVRAQGGLFTRWAYELPRALDTLPASGVVRGQRSGRGAMLLPLRVLLRVLTRPLQRVLLGLERFDDAKRDPFGWRVVAR